MGLAGSGESVDADEHQEVVIVTLVVAARGQLDIPPIHNWQSARHALQQVSDIPRVLLRHLCLTDYWLRTLLQLESMGAEWASKWVTVHQMLDVSEWCTAQAGQHSPLAPAAKCTMWPATYVLE